MFVVVVARPGTWVQCCCCGVFWLLKGLWYNVVVVVVLVWQGLGLGYNEHREELRH